MLVGFVTRNSCSDQQSTTQGIGAAREWIRSQLAAINGMQVMFDPYDQNGCAATATAEKNVIGWIPGAHPDRIIVIGGHYDSRGAQTLQGTYDGTIPAPGANDSGSQTALVLEAARVMAGHQWDATVVFAAFAGEEQGLFGSTNFSTSFAQLLPGGHIEAMLDCDIVGGDTMVNDATSLAQFRLYSPGTPREIGGTAGAPEMQGSTDDTSPARGIMRFVGTWGGLYLPGMAMQPHLREDRPGRGGDHEPFLDHAIPAVRFIETNENFQRQHTPNDTIANLTPAYLARVTQVVVATAGSLARAPVAPTNLQVTGPGMIHLSWSGPADHYVVAARSVNENLYRTRLHVPSNSATFSTKDLGVDGEPAFFISVAAVDAAGHESLFAYPEWRCDAMSCVIQPGSMDVTATMNL